MRKLRKFLRILLILLPFSVLGVCSAEHAGGTSDVHYYNHSGGTSGGTDWSEHSGGLSTDPTWLSAMRGDKANFSPDFKDYAEKFLYYWDYFHMYGTTESIPGQTFESDEWDIPYSVTFQFQVLYHYRDYPDQPSYWYEAGSFTSDAINHTSQGTTNETWFNVDYNYNNGKLQYTINKTSNDAIISDNTYRILCTFRTNSYGNTNRIIRVVSPALVGTGLTSVNDCTVEDGNTIRLSNMSDNNYSFYCHVINEGVVNFFWNDYTYGGVDAPEKPIPVYPTDTTNNYYNNEVNYYNYMQNALDLLEDSASVDDFTFNYNWGLLSLPAGIFAGMLDALGDYSNTCNFHVSAMSFNLLGGEVLNIPAMNFQFNADDYLWLLPFRYLIALSLLFLLCKQGWLLFSNIVNGGSADE